MRVFSREIKIGILLTYLNIFLNMFFLFTLTPSIISVAGSEQYGIFSIGLSMLTYISMFDFGLSNAVIVLSSEQKGNNALKNLWGNVLTIYCVISLMIFIMTWTYGRDFFDLFADQFSEKQMAEFKIIVYAVIINFVVILPLNIYRAILSYHEEFTIIKSLSIFRTLSCFVISFPVLFLYEDVHGILIAICIINFLYMVLHLFYFRKKCDKKLVNFLPQFDLELITKIVKYSMYIFLVLLVDQLNWNYGQLLVGATLGPEQVGILSIAVMFASSLILVSTAISNLLLPNIAKSVSNGASMHELVNRMTVVGRVQSFVIFLVISMFSLAGRQIIDIWVGEKYAEVYLMTLIFFYALIVPLIQNTGLSVLQALNKFKFRALVALLIASLAVMVSGNIVTQSGTIGVVLVLSFSLILFNGVIMNVYYSKIGLPISIFWQRNGLINLTTVVISAIFVVLNPINLFDHIGMKIVLSIISILSVFIIAFILHLDAIEKNKFIHFFKRYTLQ